MNAKPTQTANVVLGMRSKRLVRRRAVCQKHGVVLYEYERMAGQPSLFRKQRTTAALFLNNNKEFSGRTTTTLKRQPWFACAPPCKTDVLETTNIKRLVFLTKTPPFVMVVARRRSMVNEQWWAIRHQTDNATMIFVWFGAAATRRSYYQLDRHGEYVFCEKRHGKQPNMVLVFVACKTNGLFPGRRQQCLMVVRLRFRRA